MKIVNYVGTFAPVRYIREHVQFHLMQSRQSEKLSWENTSQPNPKIRV